ncbi:3-oxoacyl-ACP reductase [Vagococcus xieshaowenii]|uniref:3-oxoacyl-ACP reductase n=1 Tax=Vagococcus xieshaowenii TaxID=2562451 RepID=A0AAJ5EFW5_9ENTE|nr:3-oxoacyl-ACP reductase [Vagococcus xieshaowenii]QCA27959.1 3-oxoacyl-ACP reductase [Vagococcus xieshaowenii]TFZ41273.1 3-oxoacyl-ACP reductase [Vagococcus xieshaowenii]
MRNKYLDLANQVVLVTGAASGIGLSQVEAFLGQEAYVFGVDCQEGKMLELTKKYPAHFGYFVGDICQQATLEEALAQCDRMFGSITILLNTAGILDDYLPLHKTDEDLWDAIYETNVKSMYRLTRLVLPQMLANKRGTIINMTSIAGMIAGGGGIAYTMSKHAVAGFTKQLALDYAAQGITVKGIAPGAIQTAMTKADFLGDGEMAKWVANETPVKRWAQPEEVAELTLFLATPQASYLQGVIVPIDGGWLIK